MAITLGFAYFHTTLFSFYYPHENTKKHKFSDIYSGV